MQSDKTSERVQAESQTGKKMLKRSLLFQWEVKHAAHVLLTFKTVKSKGTRYAVFLLCICPH